MSSGLVIVGLRSLERDTVYNNGRMGVKETDLRLEYFTDGEVCLRKFRRESSGGTLIQSSLPYSIYNEGRRTQDFLG